MSPHMPGQPQFESGLSMRAIERDMRTKAMQEHARIEVLGPDHAAFSSRMKKLLLDNPSFRQIPWALEYGDPLTATEQAGYQAHQADFDRLVGSIQKGAKAAREATYPDGTPVYPDLQDAEGSYSPTQRPLASAFGAAVPDWATSVGAKKGKGQGSGALQKGFERERYHEFPGDYNAMQALEDLMDGTVDKIVRTPEIMEFKDQFEKLAQAPDRMATQEAQKIFEQHRDQVILNHRDMTERILRDKENAHILGDKVEVGDTFRFQALDKRTAPYAPAPGVVKVERMVWGEQGRPPRYEVSVDGKTDPFLRTQMEVMAMKHEQSIVTRPRKTLMAEGLNTIAAHSYLGFRLLSFPVAMISNVARLAAMDSRRYTMDAVAKIGKDVLGGGETRSEMWQDWKQKGLMDSHVGEVYDSMGSNPLMKLAKAVEFSTVTVPDMLQKPIIYEASKLRLAEENPGWSTSKVESHALHETQVFSDMAGKAGDPLAAKSPLGKLFYLFQKSSTRQLSLLAQRYQARDWTSMAALVGIPVATWAAIYTAMEDDKKIQKDPLGHFLKIVKRANDWTPLSNVWGNLPGPSAVADAVSGKTVRKNVESAQNAAAFISGEE